MNTCKTCKFWVSSWRGPIPVSRETRPNVGSCDCPKLKQGYGKSIDHADEVVIEDDEGWGIETGPDFGCIHHAAK